MAYGFLYTPTHNYLGPGPPCVQGCLVMPLPRVTDGWAERWVVNCFLGVNNSGSCKTMARIDPGGPSLEPALNKTRLHAHRCVPVHPGQLWLLGTGLFSGPRRSSFSSSNLLQMQPPPQGGCPPGLGHTCAQIGSPPAPAAEAGSVLQGLHVLWGLN